MTCNRVKENVPDLLHWTTARGIAARAGRPTRQPGDLEAGAEALVQVLDGPGADAILMVAGICECDPIVIGSRSYGALVSLILGSASRRAFTRTRVLVLVVKARRE